MKKNLIYGVTAVCVALVLIVGAIMSAPESQIDPTSTEGSAEGMKSSATLTTAPESNDETTVPNQVEQTEETKMSVLPETRPTEQDTQSTEPATQPTEPPTQPAEPATRPTEPSTQPTEPTTRPTEPSTQPTEPATRPTEPPTQPTEPATRPTEPSTQPTEPATRPTDPSTQPTEPETRPTEPATQPTEPETTAPTQNETSGIRFVTWPETIAGGETGTVTIQGKPNTTYTIKVYYKSGPSSAKGLEDKVSDADGYVTWTWKVSKNTKPGDFKIVVSGGGEKAEVPYSVFD